MNCVNCGKEFDNEILAFCEICEKYYCMKCSKEHKKHRFTFVRLTDGEMTKINTGISGAGIGDIHQKFFTDFEWVSRKSKCEHVASIIRKGYPVFYCEDGKLRCSDCFYNSELMLSDPLMQCYDDNKLMWLLPATYEPHNLDFSFICDNKGVRGEEINISLTIKNNKIHSIEDITINVKAFAADILPDDISFFEYCEGLYSNQVILKEFHFDELGSDDILKIEFKVKIPLDGEIKKGQFCNFIIDNEIEDKYCQNGFLMLPDELMIYASFSYNSYSGFKYFSDIESNIIKLK